MNRQIIFAIPGDLSLPTGGYGYDRKVLLHAATSGFDLKHLALPDGYPYPSDMALQETARLIADTPEDAILLIDGLAYGAMPEALIRSFQRPIVELCHHPLALESGIDAETSALHRACEIAAIRLARGVIVTSPLTGDILEQDFKTPRTKIAVALPGTDQARRATGSGGAVPKLLAVGSIIPRKAFDVMVRALASLQHMPWTLDIAGATSHSPETVEALHKLIHAEGLERRIAIRGAMDAKALDEAYAKADLFVMSSLFEGYGMAITEALARGLPIVASSGGAVADTLPDHAGLKVPPGDHEALAKSIHEMLSNNGKRSAFSDEAWRYGQALPGWNATVNSITVAIHEFVT